MTISAWLASVEKEYFKGVFRMILFFSCLFKNKQNIKNYKNSYKRLTRENVGPLWKEMGDLVTQDMKKSEVLKDLLPSVFTGAMKFNKARQGPAPGSGHSQAQTQAGWSLWRMD